MPPILRKADGALEVEIGHLRGGSFSDALQRIKAIPGRKYDGERKLWLLPADAVTAERALNSLQAEADAAIHDWIRLTRIKETAELTTPIPTDAELQWERGCDVGFVPNEDTLKKREGLFPHQRAGVDFIAAKRRVILADDMGLGKTVQMIGAVQEYRLRNPIGDGITVPDGPKLIVCPNSVKGSWQAEIRGWLGLDEPIYIVEGSKAKRTETLNEAIEVNGWAIVNYEQLRVEKVKVKRKNGAVSRRTVMKEPLFEKTKWLSVLADEVHRVKNRQSLQAQGLHRVRGTLMVGASGTPLMNSPAELWSILKWLFPEEYTAYWTFFESYVDYFETNYGKEIVGVKNPDALRFELSGRLIRRTKDEILDLPKKMRQFKPVYMGTKQKKLYDEAEDQMWVKIQQAAEEGDSSAQEVVSLAGSDAPEAQFKLLQILNGAARTVRLRQVLETPANLGADDESAKLDAAVEIILDAQPKQFGVFCQFVPTTTLLVERLKAKGINAESYTGELSPEERTDLEHRFQLGQVDVIVGTIEAMKEGITLHASDTPIFVSRHFNPAVNEQCEDRFHRIGQKEAVTVIILEVPDTVDTSKVRPKLKVKDSIVKTVIKKDHIEEQEA